MPVGDVVVLKFGGSVLVDSDSYLRAASIVGGVVSEGYSPVVVVSAMKGVTDRLIELSSGGGKGLLDSVKASYMEALRGITGYELYGEYRAKLGVLLEELEKTVWAVGVLGEATPRVRDFIVSHGEKLSAVLMEAALRRKGFRARWLTGGEAGVVTDYNYGEARVDLEESRRLVGERIPALVERGVVPVVTGFIGETPTGETTTLGRGGSDYSAALLGALLDAAEVRLYTNVEGVLTGDPRRIKGARTVSRLSVEEAMELSYMGAKKFHPRTFEPLKLNSVPVRILSFHNPSGGSTVVHGSCDGDGGVKAVHLMEGLAVVRVRGPTMVGRIGTAMEVVSHAWRAGVNISAIAQPASETVISLIVREDKAGELGDSIRRELVPRGVVECVDVYPGMAALAVVGCGLRSESVLGGILSYLRGARVEMVATGLGKASISAVMPLEDAYRVERLIHDEVILGGQG